jgi:hypothetical protein
MATALLRRWHADIIAPSVDGFPARTADEFVEFPKGHSCE